MSININSKDITYTADGDFLLSPVGDLNLSGIENDDLLEDMIYRRLSHSIEEWDSTSVIAANLKDYIGFNANTTTANIMLSNIVNSLTAFRLIKPENIITTTPSIIEGSIIFLLSIKSENEQQTLNINIIYDTRDSDFVIKFVNQKAV